MTVVFGVVNGKEHQAASPPDAPFHLPTDC